MNFLMFLVNTPKASWMAVGIAVAQILKYTGLIPGFDPAQIDKFLDAVSIIMGFIGLYFAGKGKWPEPKVDPPK
jgi:hypothetical protein